MCFGRFYGQKGHKIWLKLKSTWVFLLTAFNFMEINWIETEVQILRAFRNKEECKHSHIMFFFLFLMDGLKNLVSTGRKVLGKQHIYVTTSTKIISLRRFILHLVTLTVRVRVVTCVAFSKSNLVWLTILWVSCSWDWSWLFSLETSSNNCYTHTRKSKQRGGIRKTNGRGRGISSVYWTFLKSLVSPAWVQSLHEMSNLRRWAEVRDTAVTDITLTGWRKRGKSNRAKAAVIPGTQVSDGL